MLFGPLVIRTVLGYIKGYALVQEVGNDPAQHQELQHDSDETPSSDESSDDSLVYDDEDTYYTALDDRRADQEDDLPLFFTSNGGVVKVLPILNSHNPSTAADHHRKLLELAAQGETKIKKVLAEESSLRLLAPYLSDIHSSSWFHYTLVDKWFDFLAENYKDNKVENISCACLDADLGKDSLKDYLQEVSKQGTRPRERARLRNASTIFYPIAFGNHYYLLVIEKMGDNVTVSCLDGLNCRQNHARFLHHGKKLVQALFDEDAHRFNIKTVSIKVPRQKGYDDCAPVICYTAERMCAGKSLLDLPGDCDYSQVRIRMAAKLSSLAPAVFFSHGHRQRLQSSMEKPVIIDLDPPRIPEEVSPRVAPKRPVVIDVDAAIDLTKDEDTPKGSPSKKIRH